VRRRTLTGSSEPALRRLIREHLSTGDDEVTLRLHRELRAAHRRAYLTRRELEAVCYWKSPRAIRHIRANTPARVRAATRAALATRSERRRLDALVQLDGVSVPMASAVLTLLQPERYGVLDIRVWQVFHALGGVESNPGGRGFTFAHWSRFLALLRHFAKRLRVSARDVERALFEAHRAHQSGSLYDAGNRYRPDAR
jgi:hypothetical protein